MNPILRAGAARIDISPEKGVYLAGFIARVGPNLGVHDPVLARALVLDDGDTGLLLIACDLLGLDAGTVASLRQAIEAATGIPAARVMIACSHTHAGPASIFLRNAGDIDSGWLAGLPGKLAAVAQSALANARPVSVSAGRTRCEDISRNRRRADGPFDTALDLLHFRAENGDSIATLFNFACHPITTGPSNRLVSADFPGVACAAIEAQVGGTALFINGASADVNPVTPSGQLDCRDGSFADMERNGRLLADAALAQLPQLQPVAASPLRAQSIEIELPLGPPPSLAELNEAGAGCYADLEVPVQNNDDVAWRQTSAILQWTMATIEEYRLGTLRRRVPVEVQAFFIGEVALVGVPGELFTALGSAIRQVENSPHIFLATFANGNIGYIGPQDEYAKPGYEVGIAYKYYGYPAALAPGAGELLAEAARRLLETQRK